MGKKRGSQSCSDDPSNPKHQRLNKNVEAPSLDSIFPALNHCGYVPAYNLSTVATKVVDIPDLPELPPGFLADAPFTHASIVESKYTSTNHLTYERLEFLGDAYIEVIATRLIYERFSHLLTGQQSALRESLVRNSTLASFARLYSFGERIKAGPNEHASKSWDKILADVFEAYVAAVVLADTRQGFAHAERWLTDLWTPQLLQTQQRPVHNRKDELARAIGGRDVKIEYLEEQPMQLSSDRSQQRHFVGIYLTGWGFERQRLGSASGINKKEAGMIAATKVLDNSDSTFRMASELKTLHNATRKAVSIPSQSQKQNEDGSMHVQQM